MLVDWRAVERRKTNWREFSPTELSAATEGMLLNEFHWLSKRVEDRLGLLWLFSRVIIARADDWSPEHIRDEHTRAVRERNVGVTAASCFACSERFERLYWHHVIEIQHGGSNHPFNKVSLCFECHRYIHPWLEEPDPPRTTAFESVGQIVSRVKVGR